MPSVHRNHPRIAAVATLGVWTGWARFSSTLPQSFPDTYDVVEVRSKLSGYSRRAPFRWHPFPNRNRVTTSSTGRSGWSIWNIDAVDEKEEDQCCEADGASNQPGRSYPIGHFARVGAVRNLKERGGE